MFKKAKLYSLLAIIVASTVVNVFALPQEAQAADAPATTHYAEEVAQTLKVNLYREAVARCLASNSSDTDNDKEGYFQGKELVNWDWVNVPGDDSEHRMFVGDFITSGDGIVSCADDKELIKELLSLLKTAEPTASNSLTYACELFAEAKNHDGCPPANASDTTAYIARKETSYDTLTAVIDGWGYDFPTTDLGFGLGPVQYYLLYNTVLFQRCSPDYRAIVGTENSDSLGNSKLRIVNKEKIHDFVYEIPLGREIGAKVASKSFDSSDTCEDVRDEMNKHADAYFNWLKNNAESVAQKPPTKKDSTGSTPTCLIDGVGWLICPVLNLMGTIADSSYSLLEGGLLQAQPVNLGETNPDGSTNGLLSSWKIMRDIANIIFIFVFLVVVLSQITNVGINNYGLKKILPRLVVGAILVNLSFYICAIAVDISNILGSSLKGFLEEAIGDRITPGKPTILNGGEGDALGWAAITALIIGGGLLDVGFNTSGPAAVSGGQAVLGSVNSVLLSVIIPLLLIVVVVVVTVVLVLIVRQVLIILLIVVSPLAFVAMLLPNTEDYFKSWRKLFQTLLIFYPVVSVVFGASTLASKIIVSSSTDVWVQIVGSAAQVLPLFITPALIKLSGGVLNRVAGVVNNPNKGPIDALRRKTGEARDYNKAMRNNRAITRAGEFVEGDSMGGRGSTRKRGLTYFSSYGSNQRKLKQKDLMSAAESSNEETYLDSQEGAEARGRLKTSQVNLEAANLNVEHLRLVNPLGEGQAAEDRKLEMETTKQTTVLDSQARSINSLTATSAALLGQNKDAEARKKRAEEGSNSVSILNSSAGVAAAAKNAALQREADEGNFNARTESLTNTTARTASMEASIRQKSAESIEKAAATENIDPSLLGDAKNAELLEQRADNNAKTTGIENADMDTKLRTTTSAERLAAAEGRDTQAYEETIGGLAPAGASFGAVVDARSVRKEKKVTTAATDSAKRVSDGAFSEEVLSNPNLAAEMGGIDPNGAERQRASAAATESRVHNEIITNKVTLLEHEKTNNQQLFSNAIDTNLSDEDREANTVLLAKNGTDKQLDDFYDMLGAMPASDLKTNLSQQYAANIGSRRSQAIGEADMDRLRTGQHTGNIDGGWIGRLQKLNGTKAANEMSADRLDSLQTALESYVQGITTGGPPDPVVLEQMRKFAQSINDFRTSPRLKDSQPAEEISSRMDSIQNLINSIPAPNQAQPGQPAPAQSNIVVPSSRNPSRQPYNMRNPGP